MVLLGVGHTNAHILRMWQIQSLPDARLTCVSNFPVATYSGMLPGVLATQYPLERMEIDLVRLCAAAGARLVVDEVTGLDVQQRQLRFAERPPLPFDVLSIGIGSVPQRNGIEIADDAVLAIKPMQTFIARLADRLREVAAKFAGRPLRVAVIGGGAGGVEIAFCLPRRVAAVLGDVTLQLSLINADEDLIGGVTRRTQQRVEDEFRRRGVSLVLGRRVARVADGNITLNDGQQIPADVVLLATGAVAPALLRQLNLPTDDRGFIATRADLRTTADAPIFAVGDSGTLADSPSPKAGVYAVRQGPVLWKNISHLLNGQPLEPYVPQRGFLKLLNTGDGRAIAEYKGLSFHGAWCWKLKDRIDGGFMDKYQNYELNEMNGRPEPSPPNEMRCLGCGGKVGGTVLARVLARLDVPPSEHVLVGLQRPDDAAVVRPPGGRPIAVTCDFFAAPLDDPYLMGRIAALNAASDASAMGAQPLAALASVTIPTGPVRQQEQLLYDVLAGALDEFRRMGATLVGGHTIEGSPLTVGFTVLADQGDRPPRTKSRLRPGDCLVLTKPLGSGVLLAAHMRAKCRAAWMQQLLTTMLLSNQGAAALIEPFDIAGLTDITGFGLAGHLLEMLRASDVAAELQLSQVPLLAGVEELIGSGLQSTLAPANRDVASDIEIDERQSRSAQYAALFDPQTSGGLLLGVPERNVVPVLARLAEQSGIPAAMIGTVTPAQPGRSRLTLLT